jgi:hypothetical protein
LPSYTLAKFRKRADQYRIEPMGSAIAFVTRAEPQWPRKVQERKRGYHRNGT